jgi:hypothetical protein
MTSKSLDEKLRLIALIIRIAADKPEGMRRSQLEKQTIRKHPNERATHGKFEGCFNFLTRNGYLIRVSRGIYKVTPEGLRFMESTPK